MNIFNRKKLNEVREDLLDKYYTIEGNKATFNLNFKTLDDITDETFVGHKTLILEQDFIDKLKEYISLLPKKYDLTININIEDTMGHDIEEINEMFTNNQKLNKFKRIQSNFKENVNCHHHDNSWIDILHFLCARYNLWSVANS